MQRKKNTLKRLLEAVAGSPRRAGILGSSVVRMSLPSGLWIKPALRDQAEADLDLLQTEVDERTISVWDLRNLVDDYHHLVAWAARHGMDARTATTTMWGGDVTAETQRPGVNATVITARRGTIVVARTMAPSWPSLRGRIIRREVEGPELAERPEFAGVHGLRFGGRWVFEGSEL